LECTADDNTTGSCVIKSTTGYTAFKKSLLTCNDGTCTDVTSPSGFYKNSDNDSSDNQLIKCDLDCESIPSSNGYYINAGKTAATDILFSCSDIGCNEIGSPGGYYLNAGDSENNLVIKCSTTACTPVPFTSKTSCDAVNNVIKSDGVIYICPTTNDEDKIEIVVSNNNENTKFFFITLTSTDVDPFDGSTLNEETNYLIESFYNAAILKTEDHGGIV